MNNIKWNSFIKTAKIDEKRTKATREKHSPDNWRSMINYVE